jgi:CelD/BcsL family acetyltransferase involved in cellulose biosynthesis
MSYVFSVSTDNSFNFLSEEYQGLFQASRATPFQHPLWLDQLYGTLAPALAVQPLIVTVRSGDGGLAMVLPLVRRKYGLMSVVEFADLRVSDYVSPVCDDKTFADILADEQACKEIRRALKPYDLLRIQKLGDDALALDQLLGVAARTSMNIRAHSAPLYAPYAQWRKDNIEPSYQKELEKKRRKLNRKGEVRLERLADPQAIEAAFAAMRHYRGLRFGDDDLLQTPSYLEFYLNLTLRGHASGLVRMYIMSLDRQPIAVLWGLAQRGQYLVLMTGFDVTGFKTMSLGSIVFEEVARDCIENGDVVLDFTIGDESYKRLFGARPSDMWMISSAGSPFGMLANFVFDHVPWASRMAKRLAHRSPRSSPADAKAPIRSPQLQEHD